MTTEDLRAARQRRAQSAKYLRVAAERERKREAAFAAALLEEETQMARQCAAWAAEATEWARRLGLARSYRQGIGADGMVIVNALEDGAAVREMKPRDFRREREKLQALLERQKYRPASAKEAEAAARAPKQSRQQVQEELQALLRDTTALTERLHSQLAELAKRGWNANV